MGKRSSFERIERDFYSSPYETVIPLLPYLSSNIKFIEPCAGDGRLIDHLEKHGHKCIGAWDIEPQRHDIVNANALELLLPTCDMIITNPPWNRKILHPLISHLSGQYPTWLLFDANWMFTKQATPYLKYCSHIITIGRVKWIEDTKMTGKDDSCWYLFDKNFTGSTTFINNR